MLLIADAVYSILLLFNFSFLITFIIIDLYLISRTIIKSMCNFNLIHNLLFSVSDLLSF